MDLQRRLDCICEAKMKTLVSCAVTAQLICVFVFAYITSGLVLYAVSWFQAFKELFLLNTGKRLSVAEALNKLKKLEL